MAALTSLAVSCGSTERKQDANPGTTTASNPTNGSGGTSNNTTAQGTQTNTTSAGGSGSSGGSSNTLSTGTGGANNTQTNGGGSAGQTGTSNTDGPLAGCRTNADCGDQEYCEFADDLCGDGEAGTCEPRPMLATDGVPVCGCDGVVYPERSYAKLNLTDTDALGRCDATSECSAGNCEWCGYLLCNTFGPSYCEVLDSQCGTFYSCAPPPENCDPLGCDCFAPSDGGCSESDTGFVTLTRQAVCSD